MDSLGEAERRQRKAIQYESLVYNKKRRCVWSILQRTSSHLSVWLRSSKLWCLPSLLNLGSEIELDIHRSDIVFVCGETCENSYFFWFLWFLLHPGLINNKKKKSWNGWCHYDNRFCSLWRWFVKVFDPIINMPHCSKWTVLFIPVIPLVPSVHCMWDTPGKRPNPTSCSYPPTKTTPRSALSPVTPPFAHVS